MKYFFTLLIALASVSAFCQSENVKILEQRAKDFHQAISKNDKDVWREYMKKNFTVALIERPMRAQVVTSEKDEENSTNSTSSETKIEAKLGMFQQLHDDFGKSKLASIKVSGNQVTMILNAGGMKGIFSMDAEANSPWLIDKLGIEVNAEN